jgi:predicted amidohydrolase YtcJ
MKHRTEQLLWSIVIGMIVTISSSSHAANLYADLVFLNANVITVDHEQPEAEAFAVRQGVFIAVGTNEDVKPFVGESTTVIKAAGKTVLPGFIDAHLHPRPLFPWTHRLGSVDLRPGKVKSIDNLIAALRAKAEITPKGEWVRGKRYEDTKLGRSPTRFDLDQATTDHPVWIGHSSGHASVVNSYALNAAGITKETPDPPGGAFDRDEKGEPNGICREGAGGIVRQNGPPMPQASREEDMEGYRRCFQEFMRRGITSVGDASVSPPKIQIYQDLVETGMPVRINMMIRDTYLHELLDLHLRTGFGNEHLKIGPIKVFHGNSLSGRTCWLYEPYERVNPETGEMDYFGIPPARSQEELNRLISEVHNAGFQVAVHSNGDREIDMLLDAFEKVLRETPRENHRHRIEHCSVVNMSILERVRDLQVILALHSYIFEHGDKMEEYGERRWDMMHPNRSALDLGIVVAGNSDYGVSAADPLLRIQSLVTRTTAEGKTYGPAQKISVEEAIQIWTMGGAFASFDEKIKGSITEGKVADFVVLSEDPRETPSYSIKDILVEKTYIDGKLVFEL